MDILSQMATEIPQKPRQASWSTLNNKTGSSYVRYGYRGNALHGSSRHHINNKTNANRKMTNTSSTALPSLPLDQSYVALRGQYVCPYVKNHKAYLKLKGFDVHSVYSLNRHHKERNFQTDYRQVSNSETDLPALSEHKSLTRRRQDLTAVNDVWRPRDSTNPEAYKHLVSGLNKERSIPGHIRSTAVKSQRLGKVLTKAHLRKLLSQEDPLIPKGFYMNSANSILSRNTSQTT